MHRALQHGHGPDDKTDNKDQVTVGNLDGEEEIEQNCGILGGKEDQNTVEAKLVENDEEGKQTPEMERLLTYLELKYFPNKVSVKNKRSAQTASSLDTVPHFRSTRPHSHLSIGFPTEFLIFRPSNLHHYPHFGQLPRGIRGYGAGNHQEDESKGQA